MRRVSCWNKGFNGKRKRTDIHGNRTSDSALSITPLCLQCARISDERITKINKSPGDNENELTEDSYKLRLLTGIRNPTLHELRYLLRVCSGSSASESVSR